ncbi:HTH transcriptional regulator, ArsR family [Gottschalkia acidurici 9a]|uniref:HTH transcriptional regulator, ArsR family n=1 Tax=Gottschalkia acidurici (strain ATCC 7906 / DSM 604 / BCRC 14475 / CIP 104303 / KCTC 5404 / NCIMB 10678 / 9a) TaxID=1128398 RepID=K0AVA9_GOTA9|nr:metalloregulator ArsR/SmtB family transcription factor [Gottschalkia acidurici]AFS77209.1 HTH transcriptional regulator, ArsR family [Gottschalkia acidurici 9a]
MKDDICEEKLQNEEIVNTMKKENLSEETVIELSKIFKALGDPTRLKIIYSLSKRELCVCDIALLLEMNQSAISHQLRVLRNLRLVKYRKEGKSAVYSLDDDHVLGLFSQGLEHINHE